MTTYTGGCHCGNVRYEVKIDLEKVITCNCSHCHMKGMILTFVPKEQFEFLAGDDKQHEYRFNKKTIAHEFCKDCGVQSFARAETPDGEMVAINVRCLRDVDTDSLEITKVNGKDF